MASSATSSNTIFRALLSYSVAAAFLWYEMAVQASPGVMAPQILKELHLGAVVFGFAAGSYFYSYTVMQIPVGLLFDRFPSRIVLSGAIFVCVLGNMLFAVSHSAVALASARFLMGCGSAFAFVGVLVNANQHFPKKYFALLVGVAQLLAALGAMVGQMPLAFLVKAYGWRETVWILTAVGVFLGLLTIMTVRDSRCSMRMEKEGFAGITSALSHVVKNKQLRYIAFYAFSAWAPIALFAELWGVPYLMVRFHVGLVAAAGMSSMIWIALAMSSPILGWCSDVLKTRTRLIIACAAIGTIATSLLLFVPGLPIWSSYWLLFCMGIASSGQILSFALVKDISQEHELATAISINNMAVVVGGAIFQPLVGLILRAYTQSDIVSQYTAADFSVALVLVPLCYLLGGVVAVFKMEDTLGP